MKTVLNKFKTFNTLAFIVFCIAIGQVLSLFASSFLYDVSASQSMQALKDPIHADRNLVILLSLSYTLFSFFIIPVSYLLLYNKASVSFLSTKNTIRFKPLMLSVFVMVTIIPFITVLINLNSSIEFPVWLSALEEYFMKAEENAVQLTNSILLSAEPTDLITAIVLMAIIPGIVEEIFFRGIVQKQLLDTLNNVHYAVLMGAFLFSLFHFQFYGFIPRLIMGVLLGYIFLWSKNIWYFLRGTCCEQLN